MTGRCTRLVKWYVAFSLVPASLACRMLSCPTPGQWQSKPTPTVFLASTSFGKALVPNAFAFYNRATNRTVNREADANFMLQPNMEPGNCWPMKGSVGYAVIKLHKVF